MTLRRRLSSPDPATLRPDRRACLRALSLVPVSALVAACGGGGGTVPGAAVTATAPQGRPSTRAWRMGFGGLPPRFDVDTLLASIAQWAPRAELVAIQEEVPWTALLGGADVERLVAEVLLERVRLYRSHGLKVLFVPELNDGLARDAEAPQLRALGRSVTEPEVQQAWQRYVLAAMQMLEPDWLCLAAETNLVRQIASPGLYAAIRQCAGDMAALLGTAALPRRTRLMTSVQVETAWGRMPGQDGRYLGVETELADFGFTECLGLSSYPFLSHETPEAVPADWYRRIAAETHLSVMVTECGWSSASSALRISSPELQRRYVARHADLLDAAGAIGVIQSFYADLDLDMLSGPMPPNLPTFAQLGLTGSHFEPKAALAAWDALFARPLVA